MKKIESFIVFYCVCLPCFDQWRSHCFHGNRNFGKRAQQCLLPQRHKTIPTKPNLVYEGIEAHWYTMKTPK